MSTISSGYIDYTVYALVPGTQAIEVPGTTKQHKYQVPCSKTISNIIRGNCVLAKHTVQNEENAVPRKGSFNACTPFTILQRLEFSTTAAGCV